MTFTKPLMINAKTDREANFYAKQLGWSDLSDRKKFPKMTLDKKNRYLNQRIKEKSIANRREINQLTELYNQSKIEKNDWFWLTAEQTRAVNWKWGYLNLNKEVLLEYIRDNNEDDDISFVFNNSFSLDIISFNNQNKVYPNVESKLNNIIEFLTSLGSVEDAKDIENILYDVWRDVRNGAEIETYLECNDLEKCKWAFNYLSSIDITKEAVEIFEPLYEADFYWYSIAIFDLISDYRDKELILIKMRKAWTQHKYRSKQNGKKAYSISMSPNTKNKLEHIVERTDGKICDTIERLINDEYERLN